MSGDVQARKRKDKRKRKDERGSVTDVDILYRRLSREEDEETVKEPVKPKPTVPGVHATKMGPNDIHLHVQKDTATGGHWCAKIVFFFLMATLLGLIGLIIMENRGLADLDTPLSESRYADILEGWVDETREEHDDHVPLTHDEHDDDDDEHDDKDDNEHDNSDEEHADHHDDDDDDDEEEEEDDTKVVSEEDDDDEQELSYFERVRRMIDLTSSDKDDDKDEGEEIEKDDQKDEALDDDDDEEVVDNENDDDVDDDDEENEELEDEFAQDLSNEEDEKDDGDDEIEKAYDENDEKANNFDEDELDDKKDEGFIDDDEEDDKRDDGDNEDDKFRLKLTSQDLKMQVDELVDNFNKLAKILNYPEFKEIPELQIRSLVETSDNVNSNVNKLNDPEDDNGPESNDGNQKDFVEQLEELAIPEIEEQPTDENSDAPQQDSSEGTSPEEVQHETEIIDEMNAEKLNARRVTMVSPDDNIDWDDGNDEGQADDDLQDYENDVDYENEQYSDDEEYIEEEIINTPHPTFEDYQAMYNKPVESQRFLKNDVIKESEKEVKSEESSFVFRKPELIRQQRDMRAEPPIREPTPPPPQEEIYEDEDMYDDDEEEEDEEIESDVDDSDLLKRLEEKYGKLQGNPMPDDDEPTEYAYDDEYDPDDHSWTKIRTGGPQTLNEDDLFEEELRRANDMLENNPKFALTLFVRLRESYPNNPQIIYGEALAVDLLATDEKSNKLVLKAIETFLILFRLEDKIDDNEILQDAANKCIDRMRFIGQYGKAIPVHNMLIERYPDIPDFRNNLAVTYLYLNKMDEAQHVLHETLLMWPRNGFALVHYGFILKIHNKELEEAISFMREGIETGEPGTVDGRFYFHLGDALYRLGKHKKAYNYYEEGAKKKLFLSKYQRSLYNVNRLQSRPFWKKIDTTYKGYFDILETNFNVIRAEGMKLLNSEGYFKNETEDLRDQGDWKQLDLYSRGKRNNENCNRTPITCKIIETFPAARTCTRGQVKFSVMLPGTHVWPHCGPTNCRLRAHLGLKVPPNTFIRVADETRTWEEGKILIFDDSFEHEVWHNGTSVRLVLIVDVWHPDLTETERNNLVPI